MNERSSRTQMTWWYLYHTLKMKSSPYNTLTHTYTNCLSFYWIRTTPLVFTDSPSIHGFSWIHFPVGVHRVSKGDIYIHIYIYIYIYVDTPRIVCLKVLYIIHTHTLSLSLDEKEKKNKMEKKTKSKKIGERYQRSRTQCHTHNMLTLARWEPPLDVVSTFAKSFVFYLNKNRKVKKQKSLCQFFNGTVC